MMRPRRWTGCRQLCIPQRGLTASAAALCARGGTRAGTSELAPTEKRQRTHSREPLSAHRVHYPDAKANHLLPGSAACAQWAYGACRD
eukprot:3313694-Ditylum_brightwellii.AAC.1